MCVFFGRPSRGRPGSHSLSLVFRPKISKQRKVAATASPLRGSRRCGAEADFMNCSLRIAWWVFAGLRFFSLQRSTIIAKRQYCACSAMRRDFTTLPFSALHGWEPRRGQDRAVAFFCLAFLGETRKVSGCRAAPGKVVRRKQNIINQETNDRCFLTERH